MQLLIFSANRLQRGGKGEREEGEDEGGERRVVMRMEEGEVAVPEGDG